MTRQYIQFKKVLLGILSLSVAACGGFESRFIENSILDNAQAPHQDLSVDGLIFASGAVQKQIEDGDTLEIGELGDHFSLEAVTSGKVISVELIVNNERTIAESAPFSAQAAVSTGTFTVQAVPYAKSRARGGAGQSLTLTFSLVEATDPTLPMDPPEDPMDPPQDPMDPPQDPMDPPQDPMDPPPPDDGAQVYDTILYVNGATGSDSNAGTSQTSPLKTVARALQITQNHQRNGRSTKVEIAAGVYREAMSMFGNRSAQGHTLITASQPGTVVISGSDRIQTTWQNLGNNQYLANTAYSLSRCTPLSTWPLETRELITEVMTRREIIFLNGTRLTQVTSRQHLQPGSFFLDESNSQVIVSPPSGVNMATAIVEYAKRPRLIELQGTNNVTLRGLTFQHAASCFDYGALHLYSNSNLTLDQLKIHQNNGAGIAHGLSDGTTIRDVVANYNGGTGVGGYKDLGTTILRVDMSYNNWRAAQAGFYGWAQGGSKVLVVKNLKMEDVTGFYNYARGYWIDTGGENVSINRVRFNHNLRSGFWSEGNVGPIHVQNSNFCNNNLQGSWITGGFDISNTHDITVENSVMYNNGDNQIMIGGGNANGRTTTLYDGSTRVLYLQNIQFLNNIVVGHGGTQRLVRTPAMSSQDLANFRATSRFSGQKYYHDSEPRPFEGLNGVRYNFAEWKQANGFDADSSYVQSSISAPAGCEAKLPAQPDFMFYGENNYLNLSRGKSGSRYLGVQSLGHSTAVQLRVYGAEAFGGQASLSSQSISGTGRATLKVDVPSDAPLGNYTLSVVASDGQGLVRTMTVLIRVK